MHMPMKKTYRKRKVSLWCLFIFTTLSQYWNVDECGLTRAGNINQSSSFSCDFCFPRNQKRKPTATIERAGSTQLMAMRPEGEVDGFCDILIAVLASIVLRLPQ